MRPPQPIQETLDCFPCSVMLQNGVDASAADKAAGEAGRPRAEPHRNENESHAL
jgi:hypothetical protein